jgi:hypothetical protein
MYFNIGMKTIYLEVFQQAFGFPSISTRKGKIAWYCLGPIYWILAFVVAASVPNIGGIVSFVGALFMINFTYSFPGMLILGHIVQKAAALPGEGFNPYTRVTTRLDTGMKRWTRGFKKSWKKSLPLVIYVLLGLACCGMGIWAAIEGLISVFGPGGTVATCKILLFILLAGHLLTGIYSFRMSCPSIGLPIVIPCVESTVDTFRLIHRHVPAEKNIMSHHNIPQPVACQCAVEPATR